MKKPTLTIECKAWNESGELGLHLIFHFSEFRDRLASIDERSGSWNDAPFHFGEDADSIAARFVPAAEASGWTAEITVEGTALPSKYDGETLE